MKDTLKAKAFELIDAFCDLFHSSPVAITFRNDCDEDGMGTPDQFMDVADRLIYFVEVSESQMLNEIRLLVKGDPDETQLQSES